MIHSGDVFRAAEVEGINVQVDGPHGTIGVLQTRQGRGDIDVIARCNGAAVLHLIGITDIGRLFVENDLG